MKCGNSRPRRSGGTGVCAFPRRVVRGVQKRHGKLRRDGNGPRGQDPKGWQKQRSSRPTTGSVILNAFQGRICIGSSSGGLLRTDADPSLESVQDDRSSEMRRIT